MVLESYNIIHPRGDFLGTIKKLQASNMSVARLRQKMGQHWPIFLSMETICLSLLAMLTDGQLENLEPDTVLYDPETKERKPMIVLVSFV